MAHTTITLNGRTLLDDPLDQWHDRPPEELKQYLRPGAAALPWVKPAMVALADAAMLNQPIRIDVQTTTEQGWVLAVSNVAM